MNRLPFLFLALLFNSAGSLVSQDFSSFPDVEDTIQVFDDTEAGRFFSQVFEQYEDEFLHLGSPWIFTEGRRNDTDAYFLEGSFYQVDSLATGNARYLREVTPAIIDSFSDVTIYWGIHGTHDELSPDGFEWYGYACGDSAGLIRFSDKMELSPGFIRCLGSQKIAGNNHKQAFCIAVLDIIANEFKLSWRMEKTEEAISWVGDVLHVKQKYLMDNEIGGEYTTPLRADFVFKKDRLIDIKNIALK
jgi:hypothetical protein